VAVFPIKTDKSLDKPVANSAISASYWPLTLPANPAHVMAPTAITASGAGAFVYVAAYDATTSGGYIFGFTVNSDGTLTALNGGVPFPAGIHPSAIVSDPTGTYLYVTDANSENVLGYQINAGLLTPLSSSPFKAGSQPSAMAIDASGKFAFVTNAQDSNLTAYSIGNGALTSLGTYTTGSQPMAVGIDPSKNEFVYTANFLGNTVSGFAVNASNGSLLNSQGSPYVSNALPTAVAAIPHGSLKKK
jgi:DNA-binding beta-propeller fold protein YncE